MKLEGSCHCRSVRFSVDSRAPSPFMRCYCSICRKTAGAGGDAINLGPDLIPPHASAIDTPLPAPPERVHMMLGSKANWADPCVHAGDQTFDQFPDESLAEWHARHGLDH